MKLSAPPHTFRFPAPASSPLCSAALGSRSLCCLRGKGPRGSGSEPGALSPVAAQDWARRCVLGGFWGGLPILLFTPPWADLSMGTLTWRPCTGPHGHGSGAPTPPSRRWTACPPHRPHLVGSSAMTVTVSQACLVFSELGLASMAAASAHLNFCSQQRRVPAQIPTQEEGDTFCPDLLASETPMPFHLGLVSHGVCALRLPKGRIQYRADLAQNGAETGLDGLWDLGKDTPLPAFSRPHPPTGGLKRRLEGRLFLYERVANFLVLFFHRDSGSSLPAWLLWVAEHITAPCIQATALKMQRWMQLCTEVLFKMAIHFKKS